MSLLYDLDRSLAAVTVDDRDQAAVTLARLLAEQIDEMPEMADKLSSKLLAVLVQLQLTPQSRKAEKANDGHDESEDRLATVLQLVQPAG